MNIVKTAAGYVKRTSKGNLGPFKSLREAKNAYYSDKPKKVLKPKKKVEIKKEEPKKDETNKEAIKKEDVKKV
jgi:hypothetical protein